jgi:hypothetical protein
MTTALEGGEGSASRPGRSLPPERTRYPLYRRLGRPQGRSEHVRKISPPPGFDPWTVQPAAIRYTDYATRPTDCQKTGQCFFKPERLLVLFYFLKKIYLTNSCFGCYKHTDNCNFYFVLLSHMKKLYTYVRPCTRTTKKPRMVLLPILNRFVEGYSSP